MNCHEDWRSVEGFEGLYEVSNYGRVRSVDHYVKCNSGRRLVKGRLLKVCDRGNGYAFVTMGKDGKQYNVSVHIVVAKAFIPNPNNLPCVNHKDENPRNNCVDNLEWCTYGYNLSYNDLAKRKAVDKRLPILQYSKDGKFIKEWSHAREAAEELGLNKRAIYNCCQGRTKTSGGFIWKRK